MGVEQIPSYSCGFFGDVAAMLLLINHLFRVEMCHIFAHPTIAPRTCNKNNVDTIRRLVRMSLNENVPTIFLRCRQPPEVCMVSMANVMGMKTTEKTYIARYNFSTHQTFIFAAFATAVNVSLGDNRKTRRLSVFRYVFVVKFILKINKVS